MKKAILVPRSHAQSARQLLEAHTLWDRSRKLDSNGSNHVAIPVLTDDLDLVKQCLREVTADVALVTVDLPSSKSQKIVTPAQLLHGRLKELLEERGLVQDDVERLIQQVPSAWERHGDLVLLPPTAFVSPQWQALGKDLWRLVAECVGVKRVARRAVICADGFRSPQVELLLADDGVVQHTDNGIRYEYDITRCMFSIGNITEKLRVARFTCHGETVVDLYAGIGYFTLPYLVHARADHVHACEWSPEAVKALRRNLTLNGVADRCTVHEGDNRQLVLRGVADRVNLGLIPSSETGWPVACRVLRPTGGVMHVHGNVNTLTACCETLKAHDKILASKREAVESNNETLLHECETFERHDETLHTGSESSLVNANKLLADDETCTANSLSDKSLVNSDTFPANCDKLAANTVKLSPNTEKLPPNCEKLSPNTEKLPPDIEKLATNFEKPLPNCDKTAATTVNQLHAHNKILQLANCEKLESESEKYQACVTQLQAVALQGRQLYIDATNSACATDNHTTKSEQLKKSETQGDTTTKSEQFNNPDAQRKAATKSKQLTRSEEAWRLWGETVCERLKSLLEQEHGGCWCTSVVHIEHVKSYAPHVDHVVLDIRCTPQM